MTTQAPQKPLAKQNKAELLETAAALGLQLAPDATNAAIVAAIEGVAGVSQDEPTQPRPIDGDGRKLDEHGLPISGPARQRALKERGIPDPALPAEEAAPEPSATAPGAGGAAE